MVGVLAHNRGRLISCSIILVQGLRKQVLRNVGGFRLREHHFQVEWLGGSNICDPCGCYEVQDDKHFHFSFVGLLKCVSFAPGTKTFLQICSGRCICLLRPQTQTPPLSWLAITASQTLR